MRRRGMAWLAAGVLVLLFLAPWPGFAAPYGAWPGMPILLADSPSFNAGQSTPAYPEALLGTPEGVALNQEGSATLRMPLNLELTISFLYNREPAGLEPKGPSNSLLYNYSLHYRLLPNLQVGLNAYLFHPSNEEGFAFQHPLGEQMMGLGPGLKYNLGRWNFVLKSQMETGNRKGQDLQNWFRVWYAF